MVVSYNVATNVATFGATSPLTSDLHQQTKQLKCLAQWHYDIVTEIDKWSGGSEPATHQFQEKSIVLEPLIFKASM